MKKTLSAAAICAVISPLASLTVVSEAAAEGTNVKVGGYVRGQYVFTSPDVGDSSHGFGYRTRLQFDSTSNTGIGKVIGQLRVQGDGGTSDANAGIDRALIRIGSLRLGYSDSWQTTFHGYGNSIERNDGDYGYDQAFFIDYSGTAGGFKYGVGIQDTDDDNAPSTDVDPYFGVGFGLSNFDVAASYLQDMENEEGQYKVSASGSFAGASVNAFYRGQTGPNRYSAGSKTASGDDATILAENASFGGSLKYAFSDTMAFSLSYSQNDMDDSREISSTLFWDPAPGINVRPEVTFYENDDLDVGFRVYRRF